MAALGVRKIYDALFRDDSIARAFVRWHLSDDGQLAAGIHSRNREPGRGGSTDVERAGSRGIVEVIDAIASVDGG